jgi:ABC-type antimicrobial peptide transport system permease subunit
MVIALFVFLINFTSSLGLYMTYQNIVLGNGEKSQVFTGAINLVYSQFYTLIIVLLIALTVVMVVVVTSTLVISKKRDIAIMKALGTLPKKLYSFYLIEVYILYLISFVLGLIFGLISFGIIVWIASILGLRVVFQIDLIFTPILFFSCLLAIFLIPGFFLRKLGSENIIRTFSRDIPFNYDASKKLTFIPKWLSSLGLTAKIAIFNTIRRKGEFKRYMIAFSLIFLVIFTLGLGNIVLSTSSQEWVHKSQGENIVVIGHKDVLKYYSLMYQMFSNPQVKIDKNDIEFTDSKYLFNFNQIKELERMDGIEKIDKRLINFCDVKEVDGIIYNDGYEIIGKQRTGNVPVIGIDSNAIIQNFEIEGRFVTSDNIFDYMIIGDGLAYNFFDYPLNQSIDVTPLNKNFKISGVVIDSFYAGYAGYVGLDVFREMLNLKNQEINLVLLKLKNGAYDKIKNELQFTIKKCLGEEFSHLKLDAVFNANYLHVSSFTIYPAILIVIMTTIAILSIYNYQKAGLMEKAKDFLIMKAIGSKNKLIKKMLFLESLFLIVPSLLLSLGLGMILNSIVLFERTYLPPLQVPFVVILAILSTQVIFNYLSLNPIVKKISRFTVKDFEIY